MDGAAQGLAFAFEGDRRRDAEKAETAARNAELEAENAKLSEALEKALAQLRTAVNERDPYALSAQLDRLGRGVSAALAAEFGGE